MFYLCKKVNSYNGINVTLILVREYIMNSINSQSHGGKKRGAPKMLWGRPNKNWKGPERAQEEMIGQFMAMAEADYIQMTSDFDKSMDMSSQYAINGDGQKSQEYAELSARIYNALQERTQMMCELSDNGLTSQWVERYADFREKNGLPASRKNPSIITQEDEDEILSGIYDEQGFSDRDLHEVVTDIRKDMFDKLNNPHRVSQKNTDDYHDLTSGKKRLSDIVQDKHGSYDTDSGDNTPTEVFNKTQTDNGGGGQQPPRNRPKNSSNAGGDNRKNGSTQSNQSRKQPKDDGKPKSRKKPGLMTTIEEKTGLDKNGAFRVTWRPAYKGFVFNIGRHGLHSISYRIGNSRSLTGMTYRIWSRDRGTGISSINLPGGASYRFKDKRQKEILRLKQQEMSENTENTQKRGIFSRIFGN